MTQSALYVISETFFLPYFVLVFYLIFIVLLIMLVFFFLCACGCRFSSGIEEVPLVIELRRSLRDMILN